MKNKDIVLSIVVGSIMSAGMAVSTQVAANPSESPAAKIENKAPSSSGKCASGKCGTEKIYGQAKISHDPQDHLVRARDGKCGLTGQGLSDNKTAQQVDTNKCINGVCGK